MAWPKRSKAKNLIGERVRQARQARQPALHQADLAAMLAEALGRATVDRATVTRIESGIREVTDIELVALARVLGVSTTWLLFGESSESGGRE